MGGEEPRGEDGTAAAAIKVAAACFADTAKEFSGEVKLAAFGVVLDGKRRHGVWIVVALNRLG